MSLFNIFKRRKKTGSSERGEPRLMSISGDDYTDIRIDRPPEKKAASKGGSKQSGSGKKGKKKRRPQGSKWYWRLARKAALPVTVVIALFSLWIWYDLPNIAMIGDVKKTPSITIKSDDGTVIGSDGDVYGDFVPYDQLPPTLINAVVATEDRNFFHHFGVDPFGMLRATFVNITHGHLVQGGSTITQQLAKNAFLSPDRTLKRKVQEMILALELEKRYSKKDILAMYLNRVFMGANCYGVDAASKRYFGHPVQEVTLNEAALLVGLLKAPTRYAPTTNPDRSEKRGTQVLINMQNAGYLTQNQVDEAKKSFDDDEAVYRDNPGFGSYYFKDYVTGQVVEMLGSLDRDIVVTTTLQADKQHLAEDAVTNVLSKKGGALNASQAALLSMTPDGAIRAMVGGRSYRASQFNRVTQALRQPGSSFKLFVFLSALEAGYTPQSEMEDKPITIGKWKPRDYTGKYKGMMTLRDALAESINSIAVQLSEAVGRNRVIDMAQRLGISETIDPNPSLALGTSETTLLEMTKAYAHLAANGDYVHPYAIKKIESTSGEVLFEHKDEPAQKALEPNTVAMMNNMLLAVTTSGTGRTALIGRPVAGKTGTASDYRDAWFIGFVPQLVTGVWVGNDDTSPMKKVTGGSLPASIFKSYMVDAVKEMSVANIPNSSGPDSSNGGLFGNWFSSSSPAAGNASPSPHDLQHAPSVTTPNAALNMQAPVPQNTAPHAAPVNDPFAVVDKEDSGDREEPSPQYNAPSSFWDRITGNAE